MKISIWRDVLCQIPIRATQGTHLFLPERLTKQHLLERWTMKHVFFGGYCLSWDLLLSLWGWTFIGNFFDIRYCILDARDVSGNVWPLLSKVLNQEKKNRGMKQMIAIACDKSFRSGCYGKRYVGLRGVWRGQGRSTQTFWCGRLLRKE